MDTYLRDLERRAKFDPEARAALRAARARVEPVLDRPKMFLVSATRTGRRATEYHDLLCDLGKTVVGRSGPYGASVAWTTD